jgi:hypothetical protein
MLLVLCEKKVQVINDDNLGHDNFTLKLQLIVYHCTHWEGQKSYCQTHANTIRHPVVKKQSMSQHEDMIWIHTVNEECHQQYEENNTYSTACI